MNVSFSPSQMGLGSICALLTLAIVYEVSAPLPELVVVAAPLHENADSSPRPQFFNPPPLAAFSAINERPIFAPGRKPVVPKPTAADAPPPPPPSVTLIGVIMDAHNSLALIKTSASPLETSVRVGADVAGWQLTRIEPDRIVLHFGTTDDEIRLEANRAKGDQGPAGLRPALAVQQPLASELQPSAGGAGRLTAMPNIQSQAIGQSSVLAVRPGAAGTLDPQVLRISPSSGTDKHN